MKWIYTIIVLITIGIVHADSIDNAIIKDDTSMTNITLNETRYFDSMVINTGTIYIENYRHTNNAQEKITFNITEQDKYLYENSTQKDLPYITHTTNTVKLLNSNISTNIRSMQFPVDACIYNTITFWWPATSACANNIITMQNTMSDYQNREILLVSAQNINSPENAFYRAILFYYGMAAIMFLFYLWWAYHQFSKGYWGIGYLVTYSLVVLAGMWGIGAIINGLS